METKSFLSSLFTATRFHIEAQGRGLPRTLGARPVDLFTLKALYKAYGRCDLCNAFSVYDPSFNNPRVRGGARP